VKPGNLSAVDFDTNVADLVSFMSWMSEPSQNQRRGLGVWVLLFLGLLMAIVWRLNASYWKEVK
jgi:ubiquinol-cytochrome c reductase cytochrome c1 subunit